MTCKQAEKMVKKALSQKRFTHTVNVKNEAVEMAKRFGASEEKAALAALLHDAAKELPKDELLQILRENAIIAGDAENSPPPVWHGVAAAILAQTRWGVEDQEVLDAIRYHTTGRPGMTKLDKIIFLSDMISAERDYPEVEELRQLAKQDLDVAVTVALRYNVEWMEACGKTIDPLSRQALDDLEKSVPAR
ncbi:MAG TPA: bis(5'-nucleosyl)-tetraphosphatase (symmetrical) YqeK [Candidatus Fournierella merdigallinarum]|nr:bis(5'-nucleosyl)-tetraphosphatase (symmetrical) YqeK [Candidatus Fournierella merdigallinarum]